MPNYTHTTVVGHIGRDPETKYMSSGDAVCNFSVAVSEKWKTKDGDSKESTTWFRVNAFGKLAEICGQHLKKGAAVLVAGKMQCRKYEKDGQERESWELRADSMQMLGGRDSADNPTQREDRQAARAMAMPTPAAGMDDMDDDVPFVFNMNAVSDTMGSPKGLMRSRDGKRMLLLQANQADF